MNRIEIMDCTLRDGANVVGTGFDARLTKMMIKGLIDSNIKEIEFGNAKGLGVNGSAPLTDEEYMELVQPYLSLCHLGMFVLAKNATEENVSLAAEKGLNFLRVGAAAGDGETARAGIGRIKDHGMTCKYSMMKAYLLSAEELAQEAALLESYGVDEITIMDSSGTMTPLEVGEYVRALIQKVGIPIGFHGHNNLGLSSANALAAVEAGAASIDGGLMGMARSAGNCTTEMVVALLQRENKLSEVNLFSLLDFIDNQLEPAMKEYGYYNPVSPLDLVYGLSGCHSSFEKRYQEVASEKGVSLYELIIETSKIDRKDPSMELILQVADRLL